MQISAPFLHVFPCSIFHTELSESGKCNAGGPLSQPMRFQTPTDPLLRHLGLVFTVSDQSV